jgi:hypothetical protein
MLQMSKATKVQERALQNHTSRRVYHYDALLTDGSASDTRQCHSVLAMPLFVRESTFHFHSACHISDSGRRLGTLLGTCPFLSMLPVFQIHTSTVTRNTLLAIVLGCWDVLACLGLSILLSTM